MTRFFCFLLSFSLLLLTGMPGLAMGVSDFAAVAETPGSALYNPAGLNSLQGRNLTLEHRFTGRDLALGWDDLVVYSVTEKGGTGALFLGYSQDIRGIDLYNRILDYGYAYGWRPSANISLGLAGKFSNRGIYSDTSGTMVKQDSQSSFLLDLGAIWQVDSNWRLGLAFHNIGRDEATQVVNYQSTIGCSYRTKKMVLAAEIYDFLNEGHESGGSLEGSLARVGGRFNIGSKFRVHAVLEDNATDWNYFGAMLGAEGCFASFTAGVFWYRAKGDYVDDDTVQLLVNYRF